MWQSVPKSAHWDRADYEAFRRFLVPAEYYPGSVDGCIACPQCACGRMASLVLLGSLMHA